MKIRRNFCKNTTTSSQELLKPSRVARFLIYELPWEWNYLANNGTDFVAEKNQQQFGDVPHTYTRLKVGFYETFDPILHP